MSEAIFYMNSNLGYNFANLKTQDAQIYFNTNVGYSFVNLGYWHIGYIPISFLLEQTIEFYMNSNVGITPPESKDDWTYTHENIGLSPTESQDDHAYMHENVT